MSRTDFDYADQYAFYLAYGQACGYCNKLLRFADLQIDHVIPQNQAKDPKNWQRIVAEYGLPVGFDVDSDENRMSSCGEDNGRKSGDLFPVNYAILLLQTAANKAPIVRELRSYWINERKLGRTLAAVGKALSQHPSFRDEVLAVLEAELPIAKRAPLRPWGDEKESSRIKQLLGAASDALLAWPQNIAGHWLERAELSELETAMSGDQSKVVVLLGSPGSGKSAILARLGTKLRDEGCTLLAIKADLLPSNIGSLRELDEWLQVSESLPVLIGRLAAESPITILIDQLDALAELMDTRTDRLSALLSLIDRTSRIPRVRVIVSCREFDASHDLRLRSLVHQEGTTRVELTDPMWDVVSTFLRQRGFDPKLWPDCVRNVLRRPQHLKLFLTHFDTGAERPTFESYQAMLELILQERVVKPFGIPAIAALEAMSAEMAAREELWLPRAKIEREFRSELIQLRQAGLVTISADQTRIGFGHQTVFDFLRARSLVAGSRNLFEEVKARQDGLSMRPELWSSIGYLRNADSKLYCTELSALLRSAEIRPHIQILLIEFLGTVSAPMAEEASSLRPLLAKTDLRPHIMRAIAKKQQWFPAMRSAVARSSDFGAQAAYQASWVLGPALTFDRSFGLQCLRRWSTGKELDPAIFNALSELREWDHEAFEILEKVIERTEFAEMWVCKIAQDISRTRPDLASQVVRTKLNQQLAKAHEQRVPSDPPPIDAPVEQQIRHLLTDKGLAPIKRQLRHQGEWYGLDVVAKNGPDHFIEILWPWVEDTARELYSRSATGAASRYRDDHEWHLGEEFSSYLGEALWLAASEFATARTERFLEWVGKAAESEMSSVHRLIVRGLTAIAVQQPVAVMDYLLSDGRRFAIGSYLDGGNNQTLALLKAVGPALTDWDFNRLIQAIESWKYYDPSKIDDHERRNEEARDTLLAVLPQNRLPQNVQEKLTLTLRRTGSNFPGKDLDFETEGGWVASPVKSERMQGMSEAELLTSLEEYPDKQEQPADSRIGGSLAVAIQLKDFATKNPDRVFAVIRKLRPGKNELAAGHGFEGVATSGNLDAHKVVELARELIHAGFSSEDFQSRICWGLASASQRGEGLPDDLILYLRGIVREPDPPSEDSGEPERIESPEAKRRRESILWDERVTTLPGGNYSVLSAITFGLLRRKSADYDQWLAILEGHLVIAESSRVWLALLRYLRFLARANRDRSIAFVKALLSRYPELIPTAEGVRFIASCHEWFPQDLFDEMLKRIESSNWKLAQQAIGELLVLRTARVPKDKESNVQLQSLLLSPFVTDVHLGLIYSAAATWSSPSIREVSHRIVLSAIPFAKDEVAEALMRVFSSHGQSQLANDKFTSELLDAVAAAPSLLVTANTSLLIDRLKELLQDGHSPVEIGKVARHIVEVAGDAIANISTALSVSASDLIDIAITLQRFPGARSDGTWIFERLLVANAYPIAKAVTELDRRF